ncbi:hypothetical protein Fot_24487 [Forsythia ovata]|uniref:Uncharacterized protein n=1 Tax=Forsythia ovata TaxID=205694 RepID=A0ABD1U6C5_9LAMI
MRRPLAKLTRALLFVKKVHELIIPFLYDDNKWKISAKYDHLTNPNFMSTRSSNNNITTFKLNKIVNEQENVVRKRKRESQPFKDEKYMRVRSKESETPPWLKSPVTYARERENAVNLPPCKAIKVRPAKIRVRFPQAQPNSKKIILSLT